MFLLFALEYTWYMIAVFLMPCREKPSSHTRVSCINLFLGGGGGGGDLKCPIDYNTQSSSGSPSVF